MGVCEGGARHFRVMKYLTACRTTLSHYSNMRGYMAVAYRTRSLGPFVTRRPSTVKCRHPSTASRRQQFPLKKRQKSSSYQNISIKDLCTRKVLSASEAYSPQPRESLSIADEPFFFWFNPKQFIIGRPTEMSSSQASQTSNWTIRVNVCVNNRQHPN